MKLVIFGLTVSSSWGNGHATIWRALWRALAQRGHHVVFFEHNVPYYAVHRDVTELPGGHLYLYPDWEAVLPLATFVLTRALTGRSDVSLLATILTVFGGAFELSSDRLWVNSLFLVGQAAYPLFPRDLVFGLLPLAVLAFVRSLEPGRTWAWALGAGLILGACALIQVQLLLPIPILLLIVAATGLGFLLSALNAYYRDIRYMLPFLLQLLLFASPIFYSIRIVPDPFTTK